MLGSALVPLILRSEQKTSIRDLRKGDSVKREGQEVSSIRSTRVGNGLRYSESEAEAKSWKAAAQVATMRSQETGARHQSSRYQEKVPMAIEDRRVRSFGRSQREEWQRPRALLIWLAVAKRFSTPDPRRE
ncbi:hypothetical protein KM043_006843 [Ampulex compressa]|nr:hypothetical protein KM043_006843 [Ampulex compressa]